MNEIDTTEKHHRLSPDKKSKEVDVVFFLADIGLGLVKVIVSIVGGTIAARYLWRECFLYFKNEERILPWPLAALFGLFAGIYLIIAAVVAWIFVQIEEKKTTQTENEKS
ncbi:MAG: hypothetical protein WCS44_04660 [Bacillota bacterium]|nr:hypothetical protein [Bacillota bacterium]